MFTLSRLTYPESRLEPYISKPALELHRQIETDLIHSLNRELVSSPFANFSVEKLIEVAADETIHARSVGVWSHRFLWEELCPIDRIPQAVFTTSPFRKVLKDEFESVDKFKTLWLELGLITKADGWLWLVLNGMGKLELLRGTPSWSPLEEKLIPVLGCDLCSHAYEHDYGGDLAHYLEGFWNLINWSVVDRRYQRGIDSLHSGWKSEQLNFG